MSNTDQLINLLSEQAPPKKQSAHPMLLLLVWVAGAFAYAAFLASFGLRHDLFAKLHETLFPAEIFSLSAVMIASCLALIYLAYPDMRQQKFLLAFPVVALLVFAAVLGLEYQAMPPETPLPPLTVQCTICILFYATLPAVSLLRLLRQQATTHPRITGSLIILAANSIGALALRLHGETDSIPHLITWHYLPMVLASVVGMVLGRIFLKW